MIIQRKAFYLWSLSVQRAVLSAVAVLSCNRDLFKLVLFCLNIVTFHAHISLGPIFNPMDEEDQETRLVILELISMCTNRVVIFQHTTL